MVAKEIWELRETQRRRRCFRDIGASALGSGADPFAGGSGDELPLELEMEVSSVVRGSAKAARGSDVGGGGVGVLRVSRMLGSECE